LAAHDSGVRMNLPPIRELLPHRPPLLLLDALVAHGEDWAECEVTPKPAQLFAKADEVPAILCVEYMAQTIGAFAGLRQQARGEPPRVGYLIGARELTLYADALAIGQRLRVHARRVWSDASGRAGQFECKVESGETLIASGTLTVLQPSGPGEEAP
jgi:predicted hotdog family 3-hydroxylacyl-ACP dehydratase